MNLTETTVVAVITVSVAGAAFTALNPAALSRRADITAAQATCRALDAAVVAFAEERGIMPHTITDVRPYVRGDITAYRIKDGVVAGPGC